MVPSEADLFQECHPVQHQKLAVLVDLQYRKEIVLYWTCHRGLEISHLPRVQPTPHNCNLHHTFVWQFLVDLRITLLVFRVEV